MYEFEKMFGEPEPSNKEFLLMCFCGVLIGFAIFGIITFLKGL